jgi:hypothetical protein
MNIERIFELFNSQPNLEEITVSHDELSCLKMFIKINQNSEAILMKLAMFFKMADPDMDLDEIVNVGENLKHIRAYYWLELFNEFEVEDWEYISKYVKKEELMGWLDMHIEYWEVLEEYEKCAIVKKIIDRCQENLIP